MSWVRQWEIWEKDLSSAPIWFRILDLLATLSAAVFYCVGFFVVVRWEIGLL